MKLFVLNNNNQKIHLNITASSREELFRYLGSRKFRLLNDIYHVNQVYAEVSDDNISTGAVVGGLIGILGGPAGILLGSALGGIIGKESDNTENEKVIIFNHSKV